MPVSELRPRRELVCVFISHDQIAANPHNKYIARNKSFENVWVQIGLFEAGSKHLKFHVEVFRGYFREKLAAFQVRIIFLFYILLTVHLDVILVNDQPDALLLNVFISCLYMFRANKCSSSGGPTCVNNSYGITHSGGWLSDVPGGTSYSHPLECVIPDDVLN
jgi:hypothetical protein